MKTKKKFNFITHLIKSIILKINLKSLMNDKIIKMTNMYLLS